MSESTVLTTDDVEEGYIACELCREPLHELSVVDRQAHYEAHFNNGDGLGTNELDAQLAVSLAQASSPDRRGVIPAVVHTSDVQPLNSLKPRENVFWHNACPSPPPGRIITPGIIPILERALVKSGSRGGALCTPLVVHYGTELWDLGWGCGYRNFLMACSALAAQSLRPEYRGLLMNDARGPPGVRNLQVWIEDAWRRGYDAQGAAQLRNRLVGTRKWIGTAELYVAFTSRGIPARLVDFPNNGHAHKALIQWLTIHFTEHSNEPEPGAGGTPSSARGVFMSTRMPVVLQHKGHSRTVIGVELTASGETNLLIYDPARRPSTALRKAGLRVYATGLPASDPNAPAEPPHHRSPTKAKDFFKRVIKKRSRTPLDEQGSKRVRGGSADPSDWEAMGKGKGHTLGANGSNEEENKVRRQEDGTGSSETRGRGGNVAPVDAIQGLDLGRVLGAFRVSAGQLGKKDQYQVLWFPMTAPLTGSERDARKVVRSERVTVSPVS
ncbi:DUF1671-domain-containing protein [Ceratobasidium sp. AG-I]|nr:DUF1671-domain-containing protein [Ceratobasidium sp. AG-I]